MTRVGAGGQLTPSPTARVHGNESLALTRIPDGTRRTTEVALLVPPVMWALVLVVQNTVLWVQWVSFGGMCLLLGIFLRETFLWARLRQSGPAKLSFEAQELHVRGSDGVSHIAIRYDGILSLERSTWPFKSSALYHEGRLPLELPDTLFSSAGDIAKLATEIQERVGLSPDGAERLRAMAERTRAGAGVLRSPPWCSLGLVVGLTLVFVLQVFLGATGGEPAVVLGASSGELLLQGEVARLLTPALLHSTVLHLVANASVILLLGAMLEGFLGRARVVLLFGLPSAVGILASALSDPTGISLGASAGGMGLIGALLAMNAYQRDELPSRLCFPPAAMTSIVGLLLISEFWWPNIDHMAHAGGLLSGGMLYWLMVRGRRLSELRPPPPSTTRLACAVGIAYGLAFVHVFVAAFSV